MLKYRIMKGRNLKEDNMIKNSSRVDFSLPEKRDCQFAGRSKAAFTLAEVLITLGIIGVVAAMTLPALVQKYQKTVYVNSLKEGYTILNNGFRMMMAKEGVDLFEDTELFQVVKESGTDTDNVATEKAAVKVLEKYFQKINLVSRADLIGKSSCADLVGKGPRFWNLGNKKTCSGNYNMNYKLPNGMTMGLYIYSPSCYSFPVSSSEILAAGGKTTALCGMIDLDINGERNPNQWGLDGYRFWITQNGMVVPHWGKEYLIAKGVASANIAEKIIEGCNPKLSTSTGYSCAARIMELDNFQMKY